MNKNLTRFRESISMPQSYYYQLETIPENLKESYNNIPHKFRLKESTDEVLASAIRFREAATTIAEKNVFDKIINKLRENGAFERKLWKFPVSRFGNLNANGRIYTRELWENVIANQKDVYYGGIGLCDHPLRDDDPGQFKDSGIVWLDMMIDDANKLIWAIGTFVGTYGRLAQEIIEAGGRVGFSSSGFGETLSDGRTINPDTYQLERVADIVTNPSQSVFGDMSSLSSNVSGNVEYTRQKAVSESTIKSNIILNKKEESMKADATKIQENKVPENPVNVSVLSKIEMKAIEKYVENMQNSAEQIKNPAAKLKEVNELLETVQGCGNEELQKKVEAQLIAARDELFAMTEAAITVSNDLGDLNTLSDNVKKVATQGLLLNEQVNDYKELCEELSIRNKELARENNILKSKIAIKERQDAEKKIKENKNRVAEAQNKDALEGKVVSLEAKLNESSKVNLELNKGNRKLEADNGVLKTKVNKLTAQLKEVSINFSKKEASAESANKMLENITMSNRSLKAQVGRLQQKVMEADVRYKELQEEFAQYKKENEPKLHIEPKQESHISPYLNMKEHRGLEVNAYWNDLVNQYGDAVLPYERQIRGAKTYREAFAAFLRYLPKIDEAAGAAEAASLDYNISSLKERQMYLEEAGMAKPSTDIDEINAAELENMKKLGLR